MPEVAKDPDTLRPYIFHGVELRWRGGDKEAIGECPWCTRPKFSVNIESGVWRCVVCNEGADTGKVYQGGNAIVFIRMLWEKSFDETKPDDYRALTTDRKLLDSSTLVHWQLAKSILTDDWILPAYNEKGDIVQLYRYLRTWNGTSHRMAWLLTPTLGHKLFGLNHYDPAKETIDLCEGIWDSTAWWEVLGMLKPDGSNLVRTASREASLLNGRNVVGVPTSGAFFDSWCALFSGKVVNLMTQNDLPRKHPKTGKDIEPASIRGMERIARMLSGYREPPEQINYLKWNGSADGYCVDYKSGYDLRDHLNA